MEIHFSPSVRKIITGACGLVASIIVVLGARSTLRYDASAGTPATPPAEWPSASSIVRPMTFTLVLLAHPDCPCTRASLTELERIMARIPGNIAAFVLFTKPEATAADTQTSELWRKACAIPGVSVRFDDGAKDTRLFGGHVSGETILFDPDGHLAFTGGITETRGHEGDNPGAEGVIRRVRGETQGLIRTPVFGCSLENPDLLDSSRWWKR